MSGRLRAGIRRSLRRVLERPPPGVDAPQTMVERTRDAWILHGPRWH